MKATIDSRVAGRADESRARDQHEVIDTMIGQQGLVQIVTEERARQATQGLLDEQSRVAALARIDYISAVLPPRRRSVAAFAGSSVGPRPGPGWRQE